MRESKVESYLRKQVIANGGLIRKLEWGARRSAPDRFISLNGILLVETKAPGKKLRPDQKREHERLRKAGVRVEVVDTLEDVDNLIENITNYGGG